MFVTAIEKAIQFTRPIHSIVRHWGSSAATPGTSTLFFVNADGWALTCRHVAELLAAAGPTAAKFSAYKADRAKLPTSSKGRRALKELDRKYGYTEGHVIEMLSVFVNCVEGPLFIDLNLHPSLDIALLHFKDFSRLLCTEFPQFAAQGSGLKPGRSLCRLGYPFPEFANYEYDTVADAIRWNATGRTDTPYFPIDGMTTRMVIDAQGNISGVELSTPGLKGQSGGPLFDSEGRVWGMQSATQHLDLDFDVDLELQRSGKKKRVRDSAFLHVGHCIHVDALKAFMRENSVKFAEG